MMFYLRGTLRRIERKLYSTVKFSTSVEKKVNIDGVNINYLRVGAGEHPVLLLPGAAGSIWTDFKPQIEGLDREKFTIIAWEPPGYGKSRPPDRTFPDDLFQRDAVWACNLMKTIGFQKFSLIGWSDGGTTSLIAAAMFPEKIRKMVTIATKSYLTKEDMDIFEKFRNIDNWSGNMRNPRIDVYGRENLQKIWDNWMEFFIRIYKERNGNLCKEMLANIKCPTLVIHGRKDPQMPPEHPFYLEKHIAGAKLKFFENGGHNLHLRYAKEFNELVTEFLTE